ncbi:MAG: LytTR family transcriptional regulator DNA-binding domain-containing protein [Bacteroidales bacterium]|nr:LytTR family transcriptional regulator DNA-binding domain-containing protein [Bacteroidales bacterium]MBN2819513.1 LytTR family transcriptional regulator DNA-binding domain-containing protein [Bacteroidales bacterium]
MEKLKAVIIEDEELGRELVKNYLKEVDEVEIAAECENGFEGAKAINEHNPHLIFLDIQMPKLNGFEMLELIDDTERPEIIFTTAYNQYAIQAFELNAIDYLLKPFSKERFFEAVNKAIKRVHSNTKPAERSISKLSQHPLTDTLERIVVKSNSKISVIPVSKIRYIEAQDDYVMIYSTEGKHLKQATMKYFESNLSPNEFLRVHRSYIIRIDQVNQLEPYGKDSYVAKLKNGEPIKISKSGLKALKEKLNF